MIFCHLLDFSYWETLKYAWKNLGMWIYLFNWKLYEIWIQFKYYQWKFTCKLRYTISIKHMPIFRDSIWNKPQQYIFHFDYIGNYIYIYWVSLVTQTVKHLPAMQRPKFDCWVRQIPWRRKWQPTPVLLLGKFHGWRSLVGYSPWGHKELDMTEQLHLYWV